MDERLIQGSGYTALEVQSADGETQHRLQINNSGIAGIYHSDGGWHSEQLATKSDLSDMGMVAWSYEDLQNNVTKNFMFVNYLFLIIATGTYDNVSETLFIPVSYFKITNVNKRPIINYNGSVIKIYAGTNNTIYITTQDLINAQTLRIYGMIRA